MAVCNPLFFHCMTIALSFLIHRSSSSLDNVGVASSENSFHKMSAHEILDGRGNFKVYTSGKSVQLSGENDDENMRFRRANGFHMSGIKISRDRHSIPDFRNARSVVQPKSISESRPMFQTTSSVKHSESSHDPAEKAHWESVLEDDHIQGDIERRKGDFEFGIEGETYHKDFGEAFNEPFDPAFLKDVRFNSFLCGPNKVCSCHSQNRYFYANCSGHGLNDFPTSLPVEATIVDLSHNTIVNLHLAAINLYPYLKRISLAHNIITHIVPLPGNKSVSQVGYLDLSFNNLTNIRHLNFLSSVETLFLYNNSIVDIDSSSFIGMGKMTLLDISHNDVQRIDETAFDSLVNLEKLYLNSNVHLGYSERVFSARLFEKLTRLEILWIQNTNGEDTKMYPNKALGKLTNLRELAIDGLGKGVALGQELKNLPHLNRLMIGLLGNCYIETIPPHFFANVDNLKSLIFSRCNFTSNISPDAFKALSRLEEYVISFPGNGYNLSKAFQDLKGLKHTNVEHLSLEGFADQFELCRAVTVNNTEYIKELKLKTLSFNYDYFSGIEYLAQKNIPRTLEVLLLRCNKLSTIGRRWSTLQHLTMLTEVDLRDQNVNCSSIVDSHHKSKMIPPLILPAAREILPLVDNTSDGDEPPCAKYANRCRRDADDDQIPHNNYSCNPDDLSVICLPPNAKVIKSSGYTEFGKVLFTRRLSPNKLCYLDFSRGLFTSWGKGIIPEGVKVADLGSNFCSTLSNETFHVNNSLEYLCIENNYLGPIFASDENGTIFSQLKNLIYLNIARNYIIDIKPLFFKGLSNLRDLNLMDNKLEYVDVNFLFMPKLRSINFSKNSIKWISKRSRNQLDALAENHVVSINLSFNPLPCTCEGIEVLQWLEYSKVRVKGSLLTCADENEESVPIRDINQKLQALKRRCATNTDLIIAGSFGFVIFVIVVLSGLLFKYRWKLIYARNIWLVKLYGFRPAGNASSQETYDANVVYCQEDRNFALDTMIEELEEKRGHKLCLEDRNFIPGSFNFNNITCAIINSKVTILLLSPGFVRTKELKYATQMALMEQYNNQTKRDLILLLCYRDVPNKEMSKDLLMLRKKGRFLDYPEDGDDVTKQGFWDRLSDEIGHTRNASTSTDRMLDSNEVV